MEKACDTSERQERKSEEKQQQLKKEEEKPMNEDEEEEEKVEEDENFEEQEEGNYQDLDFSQDFDDNETIRTEEAIDRINFISMANLSNSENNSGPNHDDNNDLDQESDDEMGATVQSACRVNLKKIPKRGTADRDPFLEFLKSFREDHPKLSPLDVVSCASCVWDKLPSFCKTIYKEVELADEANNDRTPSPNQELIENAKRAKKSLYGDNCVCPVSNYNLLTQSRSQSFVNLQGQMVDSVENSPKSQNTTAKSAKSATKKSEKTVKSEKLEKSEKYEKLDKSEKSQKSQTKSSTQVKDKRRSFKMFGFIKEYQLDHPNMPFKKSILCGLKAYRKCVDEQMKNAQIANSSSKGKGKKPIRIKQIRINARQCARINKKSQNSKGKNQSYSNYVKSEPNSTSRPNTCDSYYCDSEDGNSAPSKPVFTKSPSNKKHISNPNSLSSLVSCKSEECFYSGYSNGNPKSSVKSNVRSKTTRSMSVKSTGFLTYLELFRDENPDLSNEDSKKAAEVEWKNMTKDGRNQYRCRVRTPTHLTPSPTPMRDTMGAKYGTAKLSNKYGSAKVSKASSKKTGGFFNRASATVNGEQFNFDMIMNVINNIDCVDFNIRLCKFNRN